MKRSAILLFLLLVLLASAVGCISNNTQISKGSSRQKSADTTVHKAKRQPESKNEIPLLLTIPEPNVWETGMLVRRALPAHWDVESGNVSFEAEPLDLEQLAGDPIWQRNSIAGTTISPPLPEVPSEGLRLYFWRDSNHYIELVGYDVQSEDGAVTGRLLLGDYNGSREHWRKVKGICMSPSAAYTPDVIRVGSKIYIDNKSGYTVKAIDLKKDLLELVNYTLANELIAQVKDTLDAPEKPPLSFGSHQDILLITVGGNTKWWIWALQNDACVGKIYINTKEKKLVSFKGDKAVCEELLSETPNGIMLPRE